MNVSSLSLKAHGGVTTHTHTQKNKNKKNNNKNNNNNNNTNVKINKLIKWVIHLYIISTLKNISTQNKNKIDLKRVYLLKCEQAVCSCRKRAFRIIYIF